MSFKNLSLGNYTVTVSTDRMYQKASELEALVEKLDSALTQAAEIVKRTDAYWVGDAAEIVRTEAREGVKLAENNHKNHFVHFCRGSKLFSNFVFDHLL